MGKKLTEIINLLLEEAKKAWELTQEQFRSLENELWNEAVRPIINNIQRKAGKSATDIVKYYINKYKIKKSVTINFNSPLSGSVEGEAAQVSIPATKEVFYEIYLPYADNKNLSDKEVLILRHEIEHILDFERGFTSTTGEKQQWSTKSDETIVGGVKHMPVAGHHKNYVYFDSDYVHKIIVRDAVKAGKKVPEEVIKEYPDLTTYSDVAEPSGNIVKDIKKEENKVTLVVNNAG